MIEEELLSQVVAMQPSADGEVVELDESELYERHRIIVDKGQELLRETEDRCFCK